MNSSSSLRKRVPALALFVALALGSLAQEATPPAPKSPPAAPATERPATAPATETPAAEPATAPTAERAEPGQPAEPTAGPEKTDENSGLRRIDVPAEPGKAPARARRGHRGGGSDFPFGDHTVPEGGQMTEAVSLFGSTTVNGEVDGDAVSILGNTRVGPRGKVHGAAVAVLGRAESRGHVRGELVSVLGGVYVDGSVSGEVVAVLGNLELGPNAVVEGDIVVVGGKLMKHPKAVVRGNEVRMGWAGPFRELEWLTTWFKRCLLLGRPLAFGEHMGWAWGVAFTFLAFYALLGLLFPRAVIRCAETLETKPGSTILASVLTVLLTPVAIVLLAVTVIGAVLVPFVAAGLLFAGLFGKAVMLAWIGRRFTRFYGDGPLAQPVFAVLIGGLLVMLLYTVYGSFLLYKLLSWLGTGVVVYTILLAMNREKASAVAAGGPPSAGAPPPAAPAPVPPVAPVAPSAPADSPASGTSTVPPLPDIPPAGSAAATGFVASGATPAVAAASAGFVGSTAVAADPVSPGLGALPEPTQTPPSSPPPLTPPPPAYAPPPAYTPMPALPAASLPRATFFIRMGALLLDAVLIGVVIMFLNQPLPYFMHIEFGGFLIVLAAYAATMWKTKGTTIGGIVCGLKIVRVDNREIDWATAIVRALSCFLSLVVAGLGFIWIAIDDERQSWHDKIAGTAVVRVPKGVSLL